MIYFFMIRLSSVGNQRRPLIIYVRGSNLDVCQFSDNASNNSNINLFITTHLSLRGNVNKYCSEITRENPIALLNKDSTTNFFLGLSQNF